MPATFEREECGHTARFRAALWLRYCLHLARFSIFRISRACAQQGLAAAFIKHFNTKLSGEGNYWEESCWPSRVFSNSYQSAPVQSEFCELDGRASRAAAAAALGCCKVRCINF
eukprot:6139525-Pleurochrysis_carterae.AAC.1